jgi:hypothetical protein
LKNTEQRFLTDTFHDLAWEKISKPIQRAILALVDSAVAARSDALK